jgi:hypothetical protein
MIQVRNIFLILILMLSVLFVPALLATSIIDLQEEDDLTDTEDDDFSFIDFPPTWIRIPVHQLSVLLRLGMSIFALFIVYLGGRSKHRRFNDRTIDPVYALISNSLMTALFIRAVFNFLLPVIHSNYLNKHLVNRFSPILIPNSRRY